MVEFGRHSESILVVMTLLMARMLVAFSVIPLFVGNSVPRTIHTIFVAALALALLPMALADTRITAIPATGMFLYAAKEAVIGLVLGLIASVGFWALHIAGEIIEYQAGLTMNTTIDPLTGREDSLVGGLLMRLFTVLFLVTGGLLSLIGLLFESYRLWPLASMTPVVGNMKLVEVALRVLGEMMTLAIKLAAPFVILMMLIEVALGFLSRFAPGFNEFFLAFPLKGLILIVLLLLYCLVISSNIGGMPGADFSHLFDPLKEALSE